MSVIRTTEQLREVIGHASPGLAEKNQPELNDFAEHFIARSPFLVLSTVNNEGQIDSSPKGDQPGFVEVEDSKHIVIPDRLGNRLAYGHQNILETGRVGILFMIPGTNETLRVNGGATLTSDPTLLNRLAARGRPAVLGIRVEIEEVFFHCAKAYLRSQLWKPNTWGEKYKVSFGRMFAAAKNLSNQVADEIDKGIEADYKKNL